MTTRRAQQARSSAVRKESTPIGRRNTKITLGEMRASGVRGIIIDCADCGCGHWTALNADLWPDEVRLSDLESQLACTACNGRAVVRPDFAWQMRSHGGALVNVRSSSVPALGASRSATS